MMRNIQALTYPARFKLDEENNVLVTFRDLPGATDGSNHKEAMAQAVDLLESSLAHLVHDEMDIPTPSPIRRNEILISPSAITAAQVALYMAMRREKVSAKQLAKRLGLRVAQVRGLIDLANYPPLQQIERALAAIGHRLTVTLEAAE
jgi:antitoxin HicB